MGAGSGAIINLVKISGYCHRVIIPRLHAIAMGSSATAKDPTADVSFVQKYREKLQQNGVLLGVDFGVEVAGLLGPL